MTNEVDCVVPGLACAGACEALNQGANGRRADQLSQPFLMTADDASWVGDPYAWRFKVKVFYLHNMFSASHVVPH